MQEYEKYIARWMLSTFFGISAREKKKRKKENFCLYPDVSFEESRQEVSGTGLVQSNVRYLFFPGI